MVRRTLLLNLNYEVLAFVTERKAIRLMLASKVEVLSVWMDSFKYLQNKIFYPAILRLKYLIRRPNRNVAFSRRAVFKRDNFSCQYCGEEDASGITMDHIVPRIKGGISSFMNCVAACYGCNNKKGGRTPDEAGMILNSKPFIPNLSLLQRLDTVSIWHEDWDFYIK